MSTNTIKNGKTKGVLNVIAFCGVFTLLFIGLSFFKSIFPDGAERLVHGCIGTLSALLTTLLFLKYNKLSFADIGFVYEKKTLLRFLIGLLYGILIMGALTALVIFSSGFSVQLNTHASFLNFWILTLPLILLAYMEELGFRGFSLQMALRVMDTRGALLLTSLLFALYHMANGWSVQASLLGPGPWGIIFGLAALQANGISMSTGLHYGVNLTTSAFALTDTSFNLFVLKQSNGQSLEQYQSSDIEILLPQIAIFVLAIGLMEVYVRTKTKVLT